MLCKACGTNLAYSGHDSLRINIENIKAYLGSIAGIAGVEVPADFSEMDAFTGESRIILYDNNGQAFYVELPTDEDLKWFISNEYDIAEVAASDFENSEEGREFSDLTDEQQQMWMDNAYDTAWEMYNNVHNTPFFFICYVKDAPMASVLHLMRRKKVPLDFVRNMTNNEEFVRRFTTYAGVVTLLTEWIDKQRHGKYDYALTSIIVQPKARRRFLRVQDEKKMKD